ncbi:hypothetical protein CKM354_001225000 [Cercospora kikuchii]|uniref:Nucleolar protein 12 n=1 Tax=Cercospora kikuchii TaxID=84275 RepID=A0A9P3FLN7_9PEZI|nr:uncharacterized protein CKM354_001225000 [Cercospora kikuchii]GIZ49215.1 hypothetical protein CKM354_001225000 [Cercospora kikuchii]
MAPPAKRRKLDPLRRQKPVEELTFSVDARQEYLTGFSKRKQARKDQAREHAIQMAKEEKVRERKELREQRKADLESHVAEVNKVLKQQNALANGRDVDDISSSDDEFSGFDNEDSTAPAVAEVELLDEAEYVDEDKYTTVTVEPMGETSSEGEGEDGEESKDAHKTKTSEPEVKKKKRPWDKTGDGGVKKKKQKFRYESKAERSLARSKQKSKNSKAAKERKESGGRSSRGKVGKGGRKKK